MQEWVGYLDRVKYEIPNFNAHTSATEDVIFPAVLQDSLDIVCKLCWKPVSLSNTLYIAMGQAYSCLCTKSSRFIL